MTGYDWLESAREHLMEFFHETNVSVRGLAVAYVEQGPRAVQLGIMPGSDLGEYIAGVVGVMHARELELDDNLRWSIRARHVIDA